jgi:anti-anti-sigma factor
VRITTSQDDGGSRLKISGALDVDAAAELQCALIGWIGESSRLYLDLSEVDACDAAGLQILKSAQKTVGASAKKLMFRGLSPAIAETCAILGIRVDGEDAVGGGQNGL